MTSHLSEWLSSINKQKSSAGKDVEEREPFALVQLLWKTVQNFLKNLRMELPYDSMILLLGIYLEKPKTLIQKTVSTPMFTIVLFTIAKI